MKIKPHLLYTPRQMESIGTISSKRGYASYNFILDEIKAGRLKAENRGRGKTPYFVVRGEDILEYIKNNSYFQM